MCVGLGAVTTTFITGVLMTRKGLAKPVGSMTQYDKIRVGRGENKKYLHYGEIVPLTELKDIVFGAWDAKLGACGSVIKTIRNVGYMADADRA